MENNVNKLNDNELEQVTGGKSYAEWEAYFNSIRRVRTEDRRDLLIAALREIKDDPDLSKFDKDHLELIAEFMWGTVISR